MALLRSSEESVNATTKQRSWLMLGCVLYSWADSRDPAVDRTWWRMERPHLHKTEPWTPPASAMGGVMQSPGSELSFDAGAVSPAYLCPEPPSVNEGLQSAG